MEKMWTGKDCRTGRGKMEMLHQGLTCRE